MVAIESEDQRPTPYVVDEAVQAVVYHDETTLDPIWEANRVAAIEYARRAISW